MSLLHRLPPLKPSDDTTVSFARLLMNGLLLATARNACANEICLNEQQLEVDERGGVDQWH